LPHAVPTYLLRDGTECVRVCVCRMSAGLAKMEIWNVSELTPGPLLPGGVAWLGGGGGGDVPVSPLQHADSSAKVWRAFG
jgi:hypothetical protein